MTETNPVPSVLDSTLRAELARIPTPLLSDALDRLNGVVGLRRFDRGGRFVGTAFTVKTRPGDNLFVYKALEQITDGHAIVIDAGGDMNNAILGELILLVARSRGCVGFVVDGAIRDVAVFDAAGFPCYARGQSHRGPYKSGPGRLNVPVCIGGQVVSPGDVVVGDEDGIVVFAPDEVERLFAATSAKSAQECAIRAEIASEARHQSWIAAALEPPGKSGAAR